MRKRVIYRAADIGYTKTFDDGAFRTIEAGICTCADVMLDSQNTEQALYRLKEYPWVSVGWHSNHLWGWAVANREEIPHMVDENGKFIWGHDSRKQQDCPYEEAYIEFEAEVKRCIEILGKPPVSTDASGNRPIDEAKRKVCDKYGIVYGICSGMKPGGSEIIPCDKKWEHLHYFQKEKQPLMGHGDFDLANFQYYDPLKRITDLVWEKEEIYRIGGHPGYLDDYILQESSCNIHRVKDLQVALSDQLKDWIIENQIELINKHDLLYGTNEFQDHLKKSGNKLAV